MDWRALAGNFLTTVAGQRGQKAVAPSAHEDFRPLQVTVLYTTPRATLAALGMAARLGVGLDTCPQVVWMYAVPYTLPLEKTAVSARFLEEQISALASESPVEITTRICLCRDPRRSFHETFSPHSLIVIGRKKRWWPTQEEDWAKELRKDGHEVILADLE